VRREGGLEVALTRVEAQVSYVNVQMVPTLSLAPVGGLPLTKAIHPNRQRGSGERQSAVTGGRGGKAFVGWRPLAHGDPRAP
jgi:hypothetical protein